MLLTSRRRSAAPNEIFFVCDFLLPRLRELDLAGGLANCSGHDKTVMVTEAVEDATRKAGMWSRREVWVGRPWTADGPPQPGRIDLAVSTEDWTPFWLRKVYAIEIDRTEKTWSEEKLRYLARRRGWMPIWIRWQGQTATQCIPDICVIDLHKPEVRVHAPAGCFPSGRVWRLRPQRAPESPNEFVRMRRRYRAGWQRVTDREFAG